PCSQPVQISFPGQTALHGLLDGGGQLLQLLITADVGSSEIDHDRCSATATERAGRRAGVADDGNGLIARLTDGDIGPSGGREQRSSSIGDAPTATDTPRLG